MRFGKVPVRWVGASGFSAGWDAPALRQAGWPPLRKPGEQLREGGAGVGQGGLGDDLAGGSEDADVVLTITEIQAEGEPAADGRREGGNEGRSSLFFHRQRI